MHIKIKRLKFWRISFILDGYDLVLLAYAYPLPIPLYPQFPLATIA